MDTCISCMLSYMAIVGNYAILVMCIIIVVFICWYTYYFSAFLFQLAQLRFLPCSHLSILPSPDFDHISSFQQRISSFNRIPVNFPTRFPSLNASQFSRPQPPLISVYNRHPFVSSCVCVCLYRCFCVCLGLSVGMCLRIYACANLSVYIGQYIK